MLIKIFELRMKCGTEFISKSNAVKTRLPLHTCQIDDGNSDLRA